MIRTLRYSGGKVKKSSSNNLRAGDRMWIDLHDPSDAELKKVSKLTGVYVKDMQNALRNDELPRCVNRKNYSMIILRALNPRTGYSPFGLYVNKGFIVTVHSKKVLTVDDLFDLLQSEQGKEFFRNGLDYIFCRIVSYVTKRFHDELDKIEDKVDKLEDIILDGKVKSPHKIFDLKQTLMNVRRALVTNRDVVDIISGGFSKFLMIKRINWFSELKMEINQAISVSEMSRERLTGAMDMYMSSVSNRLNDIMKSFTVIASLLLLPMLISGIWGMNFSKIPFFEHGYGFYVPLIIMVASVFLMATWFKKKKWV
jgi:magnesium transporter